MVDFNIQSVFNTSSNKIQEDEENNTAPSTNFSINFGPDALGDFKTAEDAAEYFMINNLKQAEEVREGRTNKHNEYLKSFTSKLNFRYGGYAAMRRAMQPGPPGDG